MQNWQRGEEERGRRGGGEGENEDRGRKEEGTRERYGQGREN